MLDFGIARLFAEDDASAPRQKQVPAAPAETIAGRPGGIVGTLPYMSPEQLGSDEVDHRSDLLGGRHHLVRDARGQAPARSADPGQAVRYGRVRRADAVAARCGRGRARSLVAIVERCLAKQKAARFATARGSARRARAAPAIAHRSPPRSRREPVSGPERVPGDRRRSVLRPPADIASIVARLREQPLVAVVGPSGVGKSSFVRAGVVPALKATGERGSASSCGRGASRSRHSRTRSISCAPTTTRRPKATSRRRLRDEPGILGARLRSRARKRRTQIVLFVDQHEELYTLVSRTSRERRAFTACLAGAADDPSAPLRVIVSMRSDFLDRAAEDRRFVEELARGLVFLQPPNRIGAARGARAAARDARLLVRAGHRRLDARDARRDAGRAAAACSSPRPSCGRPAIASAAC